MLTSRKKKRENCKLQIQGFYPDNLYKVISDFQQKYHLKKDLDAVLDGDSDATLTAPNNFYGASYAISDSETSKIASAHSLDRLNTLPGKRLSFALLPPSNHFFPLRVPYYGCSKKNIFLKKRTIDSFG